jgi:hypothetical protein
MATPGEQYPANVDATGPAPSADSTRSQCRLVNAASVFPNGGSRRECDE